MNRNALIATLSVCVTAIVVSGIVAHAGNLNPSPGPISPTGPTIIDALPFIIDTPGAHVLRADLVGIAANNGIVVNVSDVSIDLGGFSVIGVPNSGAGIVNAVAVENVSVRNGTFRDWPTYGVFLPFVTGCELRNVRARTNGSGGVWVGDAATIDGLISTGAGGNGINAGHGCLVTNSSVSGHAGRGVLVGDACTLRDVIATGNGASGIETGATSVVTNCTAKNNGNAGIVLGNDSTATACSASNNVNNGFFGAFGVTIESCTAQLNGNDGFRSSTGSSITRCTSRGNDGDGIEIVTDCIAMHNNCSVNGQDPLLEGAGINATSNNNRIESNHLVGNTRGIRLAGTGTYINDNTVRASTLENYDVIAGNLLNILLCDVHDRFNVPASVKLGGTLIASNQSRDGIEGTDLVSVDLAGHALIGAGGDLTVNNNGAAAGVVHSGFIEGWGDHGVKGADLAYDIVTRENTEFGIFNSIGGIASRCVATGNGSLGISARFIHSSYASDGLSIGLSGTMVLDSFAIFNDLDGIAASLVGNSTSIGNGRSGIDASIVTNSNASSNTGAGIKSSLGLVRGNRAWANTPNIDAPTSTVLENHN